MSDLASVALVSAAGVAVEVAVGVGAGWSCYPRPPAAAAAAVAAALLQLSRLTQHLQEQRARWGPAKVLNKVTAALLLVLLPQLLLLVSAR